MQPNRLSISFILIIIIVFTSGCKPAPAEVNTPDASLKISEPVTYSFTITNPSQFWVTKNYSNVQLTFDPSDTFEINNVTIDKDIIKDGEIATVSLSVVSLLVGPFEIKGMLNYDLNGEKMQLPVQIKANTPQLGNENSMSIVLKEKLLFINPSTDFGKPKTLHIKIRKERDSKYSNGKIRIMSEWYSKLDCIEGYECYKEKDNILDITTDISNNLEIPFQITVNSPGSQTSSVSFKPTMELWYSKDGSSNWGKLTTNNFDVSSN